MQCIGKSQCIAFFYVKNSVSKLVYQLFFRSSKAGLFFYFFGIKKVKKTNFYDCTHKINN